MLLVSGSVVGFSAVFLFSSFLGLFPVSFFIGLMTINSLLSRSERSKDMLCSSCKSLVVFICFSCF